MRHLTITLIAALALLCGSATAKKKPKVFICTGTYAKAYHLKLTCEALTNCGGDIMQIKRSKAEKQGRHLCKYCKTTTLPGRDGKTGETAD